MADPYRPEYPSRTGAGRAREEERPGASERSIGGLVSDVVGNIQEIIRSEIRLARAEVREAVTQTSKAAVKLVAGAILGFYALAFLLVCIYNAIAAALWPWLSALVVGLVLGLVSFGLIAAGRKRLRQVRPLPERTAQTLKEDIEWIKNRK